MSQPAARFPEPEPTAQPTMACPACGGPLRPHIAWRHDRVADCAVRLPSGLRCASCGASGCEEPAA